MRLVRQYLAGLMIFVVTFPYILLTFRMALVDLDKWANGAGRIETVILRLWRLK